MAWANKSSHGTSLTAKLISGAVKVGDLLESFFANLTFDDPVPGAHGRTRAQLSMDDTILPDNWTPNASHSTNFTNLPQHGA